MFDSIANRYDRLNRVLSLGMDGSWRRRMTRQLALPVGARVLDVATGTADVAIAIASFYPTATVVGIDPSLCMLRIGDGKVAAKQMAERVSLLPGGVERLAFADRSFDAVTMAFGIRNVADRPRALREMRRVTRPGGTIAILELHEPESGWMRPLVRWYIRRAVPQLGSLLSSGTEYRYLQNSIAEFPGSPQFAALMREAGMQDVRIERLGMDACSLYLGRG